MTTADTTVVFTHGGGRFGNQLMLFGHLIALAEEFRISDQAGKLSHLFAAAGPASPEEGWILGVD